MNKNKAILIPAFCLALVLFFANGCRTTENEPSQKEAAIQVEVASPALSSQKGKLDPTENNIASPEQKSGPKFEHIVIPAPVEQAVPEETVTFRCAFWTTPGDASLKLFVKENGKFRICNALEMVFPQTFKADAGEPIIIYKESKTHRVGYTPYATINPKGMKDFGAIILPDYDPKNPKQELIQVFDCDERVFPYGAIRILNWSGKKLYGEVSGFTQTPTDAESQSFVLEYGEAFITKSQSEPNQILKIKFYSQIEERKEAVAHASATGVFRKDGRATIFVVPEVYSPNKSGSKILFRTVQERKKSN